MNQRHYEHLLLLFINSNVLLFLSPIKIERSNDGMPYKVRHSLVSKVGVVIAAVFAVIPNIYILVSKVNNSDSRTNNPLLYFDVTMVAIQVISGCLVPLSLWKNRFKIVKFCNLLCKASQILRSPKLSFVYSRICCRVTFFLIFIFSCYYARIIYNELKWPGCLTRNFNGVWLGHLCSGIWYLCSFYYSILTFIQPYLLFCVTHPVYIITKSFRNNLTSYGTDCSKGNRKNPGKFIRGLELKLQCSEIYCTYSLIKDICTALSDSFGNLFLLNLILNVLVLATYLDRVLTSTSYTQIGIFFYQTLFPCVVYLEAAEIDVHVK